MSFFPDAPANVGKWRAGRDDALLHRMECRACPLAQVGGNLHPNMAPTGAARPLVYMLGEAPGGDEDEQGRQFVGDSGKLLRPLIPGEYRSKLRWNNCVRTRPPKNRTPTPVELECCRPSIVRDIEATKPRAIFGFGNVPLEWATGMSGITLWRGRRIPVRVGNHSCWFYPMMHPSFLLRNRGKNGRPSDDEMLLELDLERAFGEVDVRPPAVVHTPADVMAGTEIISEGGEAGLARVRELLTWAVAQPFNGVDYETKGLRPYATGARILTIAVGTRERAVAFPFDHPEAPWTKFERQQLVELWCAYLRAPKVRRIAHNLAFELEWTGVQFGAEYVRAGLWEDTAVQASILDERHKKMKQGPFSLDWLVLQYFGFHLKSLFSLNMEDLENVPLETLLHYNAPDAKYCAALFEEQDARIRSDGLEEPYRLALRRVPTVVLSQMRGAPVDQTEVRRLKAKYDARVDETEAKIALLPIVHKFRKEKGEVFNPQSTQHVHHVFVNMLRRPECEVYDKWKKDTKYSTDESVLSRIEHPLARLILDLRRDRKRRSTYVDVMLEGSPLLYPDGCIHYQLNTIFAETGRLTCVRKGSRIQVPGGTKVIEDVVPGDLVYGFDVVGKLVLRKVTGSWHRGLRRLVRLHWRGSGNRHRGWLDVTPDHRVRQVDGTYLQAGGLADQIYVVVHKNGEREYRGARVSALHRGVRSGRNELYATGNCSAKEARVVFEEVYGWSPEHVHHRDGDRRNDTPSNLEGMTHSAHCRLHTREMMLRPGEATRRFAKISVEARERGKRNLRAVLRRKAEAYLRRECVEEVLATVRTIREACRALNCDYSTLRSRAEKWGLVLPDGRNNRPVRLERRGRRLHPYKGHTEYVRGYRPAGNYNHVVTRVEVLSGLYPVYDLEVDGIHNFIAEEICVHNCDSPNIQNYPKRDDEAVEVRRPIVAPPGHLILAVDYGQIEARVIAMFTRDVKFCRALWDRYDIHLDWAERIARRYPERIGGKSMLRGFEFVKNKQNKDSPEFKAAKDFRTDIKNQWTFPLVFGATANSASGYLGIPLDVIEVLWEEFWEEFSGIRSWQKEQLALYRERGYVSCLTGRRRRVGKKRGDSSVYAALSTNQILNSPIQGTAAEIVMDGMCRLSESGDPLLQPEINIHDDLTFLRVPEDRVDEIAEKVVTYMLDAPWPWAREVPLTVEMSCGRNWQPYDKKTNPDGLQEIDTFSSDEWFGFKRPARYA